MDIQLDYDQCEDRIRLRLREDDGQLVWWFTRRLTLLVLPGLVQRLAAVPLPAAPASAWAPSPSKLPIGEQHHLLMEYDGPRSGSAASSDETGAAPPPPEDPHADRSARVATSVHFTLTAQSCSLCLEASEGKLNLNLNRQQLHSMLEALARLCRAARWIDAACLPVWLGTPEPQGVPALPPAPEPGIPGQ